MAIVITKHRCQYVVSRGSVPETYFLKVGGLCYEFERELTDKYLPSTMNLYIAVDMGTWVVGA
jgi:hypothetical protein